MVSKQQTTNNDTIQYNTRRKTEAVTKKKGLRMIF